MSTGQIKLLPCPYGYYGNKAYQCQNTGKIKELIDPIQYYGCQTPMVCKLNSSQNITCDSDAIIYENDMGMLEGMTKTFSCPVGYGRGGNTNSRFFWCSMEHAVNFLKNI